MTHKLKPSELSNKLFTRKLSTNNRITTSVEKKHPNRKSSSNKSLANTPSRRKSSSNKPLANTPSTRKSSSKNSHIHNNPIKISDLGITMTLLSDKETEIYDKRVLFPCEIYYFENNQENRNYCSLNYPQLKMVTPNIYISIQKNLQFADVFKPNEKYNEQFIKSQENKPLVIGSNIYNETPESVNINNPSSLFMKRLFEASKENTKLKRELQGIAAEKRQNKHGGTHSLWLQNEFAQNTTDIERNLDLFIWFSRINIINVSRKTKQFINNYMFLSTYAYKNNNIKVTSNNRINENTKDITYISNIRKVIEDTESTDIYKMATTEVLSTTFTDSGILNFYFNYVVKMFIHKLSTVKNKTIHFKDINTKSKGIFYSDIDLRHLLYSIFFKIIIHETQERLTYFCKHVLNMHDADIARLNNSKNIIAANTGDHSITKNDSIPYHVIMETIYNNEEKINIQTSVNETVLKLYYSTDETYVDVWNICLSKMYFYFSRGLFDNNNHIIEYNASELNNNFKYEPSVSELEKRVSKDNNIFTIPVVNDVDIMQYSFISLTPVVIFTPQSHNNETSIYSGYGIVSDGKKNSWFYDVNNKTIRNQDNSIIGNPNDIKTWNKIGTLKQVYSTVDSRIMNKKYNILSYLCELSYYPNDVIEKISDDMFGSLTSNIESIPNNSKITKSYMVYIGHFDNDPSYPYGFINGNTSQPVYSRMHVWLYINNIIGADGMLPDVELFIINRGSRTGLDWEDIDKCITQGTAIYNQRAIEYDTILIEILRKMDSMMPDIKKLTRILLQNSITVNNAITRKIQIIASGHSLGGFLAFYLSYMSISRNIIKYIKLTNIEGDDGRTFKEKGKWLINHFIIPIVFQPFILNKKQKEQFLQIPFGVVNTVREDNSISEKNIEDKIMNLFNIYTDAASDSFCYDIMTNNRKNIQLHIYRNIYTHPNVDNKFSKFTYHKYNEIIRKSHSLWQRSGLSFLYWANHISTDFHVKSNLPGKMTEQNLETTKIQFNIDNECQINNSDIPYCLQQAKTNITQKVNDFLTN